jgi:hypothetical protein
MTLEEKIRNAAKKANIGKSPTVSTPDVASISANSSSGK